MTDVTNNNIASSFGVLYINGLALQIVYPNATGAYWLYNGMNGTANVEAGLLKAIDQAGVTPKPVFTNAPAIAPGNANYAARGLPFARWGNNATVDAANTVRAQYGMFVRDVRMDLSAVKNLPQNIIAGHRVDLSYSTFSLSQGRTIHLDEVKAKANLTLAREGNQLARQANAIASVNAASRGMRMVGAASKVLGPVGAAYDVVSTGLKIKSDFANNDKVGVGREVAQFGGRWAGMAAGGAIGAWGYAAGPIVGTVTTIGGGIIGSFLGEEGVTQLYNSVVGSPKSPNGGGDVSGGSIPAGTDLFVPVSTPYNPDLDPAGNGITPVTIWANETPALTYGTSSYQSGDGPFGGRAIGDWGKMAAGWADQAPVQPAPDWNNIPVDSKPSLGGWEGDTVGDPHELPPVIVDAPSSKSTGKRSDALDSLDAFRDVYASAADDESFQDAVQQAADLIDSVNQIVADTWLGESKAQANAPQNVFDAQQNFLNANNAMDDDRVSASTRLTFESDNGDRISDTTGWQNEINALDGGGGWTGGWTGGTGGWTGGTGGWTGGTGGWTGGTGGWTGGTGGWTGGTGGTTFWPVVLDLNGNGVKITQLSSSNHYFDAAGDGYQHATAWAGAGDGVLVLDYNADGVINQANEVDFTLWDPTATSDMQALLDVFDTNHNGKLDGGDADWSKFKVLVTNADGTTQLETLAQLGISSINLTTNNQSVELPDGSSIKGQTTYTKTDGTTGVAADVAFAYDKNGYVVQTMTTHNADGSTTIDNKAYNADGSLARDTSSRTSADGKTVTISRDGDGDGVVDSIETDVTVLNADSSTTLTVTNFESNGGRILNRTITTTSGDLKTVTIDRDSTGGGFFDQIETDVTDAGGNLTITVSDFNLNGSLQDRVTTTTNASGLSKVTQADVNGDGVIDLVINDVTVINGDGSRTETVSELNSDGTLRDRAVTATSADHLTKTTQTDANGDGTIDLTRISSIVVNADGSSLTTQRELNGDGTLRDKAVTTLSADGLSKTTQIDLNGDGTYDSTSSDVTVRAADGSLTETVTDRNADGSLRDRTVTTRSLDGRTRTSQIDANGDGSVDTLETVTVGANASIDTLSVFNNDGSLNLKTVTTTSSDGRSRTTEFDIDGNGSIDRTKSETTVANAGGGSTYTQATVNADGSLLTKTVITTSSDGLSKTTQWDTTGAGSFNLSETDVTVLNGDGSRTETVSDFNTNGSLRGRSVSTTSADRRTISVQVDSDGDGHVDRTRTSVVNADGSTVQTVSSLNADGTLDNKTVTTTSASGLSVTTKVDDAGSGTFNRVRTDVTVLNADGSRTETITDLDANGSTKDRTVVTVSAAGFSTATQVDGDGDGAFDLRTTDVTTLNIDGSTTQTVSDFNADGSLRDRIVATVAAGGLDSTSKVDVDGDGVFETIQTDHVTYNPNGSVTETVSTINADGSLRDKTVTATSADGTAITVSSDVNGDGVFDSVAQTVTNANGDKTTIASDYAANGQLLDRLVTTVRADTLSTTIQRDIDGNGTVDQTHVDSVAHNANGSVAETISTFNADGSLLTRTVITTSADGSSKTTQWDTTGAGSFNLSETDVTVLNADGSRTETVSDFNANGSLRGHRVSTVSADRRTTTVQIDSNGDGHVDQTRTTVVNADGSTVQTVSDLNADGSLADKTVTTTSASGLSVKTQIDDTGVNAFNRVRTDVTVLNADGGRTETTTDLNANGTTNDKTVVTVSATGLNKTTQVDADGNAVFDLVTTDVTVFNANGSSTETVSEFNADSTLRDRIVKTVSGSGLDGTSKIDADGDGAFETVQTDHVAYNANGSRTETVSTVNADGTLRDRTVTTTSADGRAITVSSDVNGDGVFDSVTQTVTNANGSKTTTASDYAANGVLRDRLVTTVSADGLSTTGLWDRDGNGAVDQSYTDVIVLNANGSATETYTDFNADGSTKDKTVISVSADGLSKTTQWDATGGGNYNLTETDVIVVNPDGSRTETISHLNADGSLRDMTVSSVSADAKAVTRSIDLNGDGVPDQGDTKFVNADGSTVVKRWDWSGMGAVKDLVVITTSANGLSTTTQRDTTGAYTTSPTSSAHVWVYDQVQTDIVVLNADGSRTETISDLNGSLALKDRIVSTVSANGLSRSTQWDLNGDSANDSSRTDVIVLNGNGSKTETLSDFNANGSLRSRHVQTISDDGLSLTKQWDTTGSNTFDQSATDVTVLGADGRKTETLSAYVNGSLKSRSTITTSADGLSSSTSSDVNGDGSIDQSKTIVHVENADGSSKQTVTDFNANGSVRDQSVTTKSYDGRTVTVSRDADGNGAIDQVQTTVSRIDGAVVSVIDNLWRDGSLADRATVTTSPDGLTTMTQWDLDGNGTIDRTRSDVLVVNLAGGRTETIIDTNSDGTLHQKGVLTVSADGRTKTLQKDTTGKGYYDHTEATTTYADGSSTTVVKDFRIDNTLIDQSIITVSADGLTRAVQTDTTGSGTYDYQETTTTSIDGSTVATGKHLNADGTVKSRVVTSVSADGLTKTIQADSTNAGWFDSVDTIVTRIDGSIVSTLLELNADGTTKSKLTTHTSANGESTYSQSEVSGSVKTVIEGDGNSIELPDGTESVYVDGTANRVKLNGGVVMVSSGSSVTVVGSNDIVVAASGAQVSFVGANDRIFSTQANVAATNSIASQNDGRSLTETTYGFNYSEAGQATRVYYQAGKISGVFSFDWETVNGELYHVPTVSPVFLNGTETIYFSAPSYWAGYALSVQSIPLNATTDLSVGGAFPSIQLNADGWVGFDGRYGEQGNWVLAEGSTPVTITGSNTADAQDYLKGGSGDDIIDGGLGLNDVLLGGGGNDTIYFDASSYGKSGSRAFLPIANGGTGTGGEMAYVSEAIDGGAGYDTGIIVSTGSVSISLATGNLEALISNAGDDYIVGNASAAGYIDGGAGNDTIYGASLNDILIGGSGNDALFGLAGDDLLDGGSGIDSLIGGAGNDTYVVDNSSDVVTEAAGEGVDLVQASASYSLGANIENLTLTGGASINGTGNALANVIVGNGGDNVLSGLGGNDTIDGGAGTDTAVFSGNRSSYSVAYNATTRLFTVSDLRAGAPDGVDTVSNVEIFQFADGKARYDAAGRLYDLTVVNADGTQTETIYDVAGTQPWSTKVLTYGSAGALVSLTEYDRDGTSQATLFDPANEFGWSVETAHYSSANRLVSLNISFDDQSSMVSSFDATDTATWSTQTGSGGAGTHSANVSDAGDAFTWTSYVNIIDSDGRLVSQSGTLDNGGHWLNRFDTIGTSTWAAYFNAYDASGNPTWQSGTQHDGRHWLTIFDPSNGYSWSQATMVFDANWNMVALTGTNDDGSHIINRGEFLAAYDTVAWTTGAYVPSQHQWPQPQIWGGTVAENAGQGTVVGTVAGAPGDGGTILNFAMTNSAGGKFVIDAATGVVTVAAGAQFDYEAVPSLTIGVRTTDADGTISDKTFTVAVTNVNEAPTGATMVGGTVAENSANGTVVGTVAGVDPDAGSSFTYALTNNAGGRFAINTSTGAITVASGTLLDYETATSHNITVRVTDQGGLTVDKNFTISVTNVNDAPTGATLSSNTVTENAANGTVVGTVSGTDPDAGATLSYSLTNNAGGRFAIGAASGVITVANGTLLDYETAQTQSIAVRVTDQGGLTLDKTFTINITNLNEAPTNATMTGGTVAENAANGTVVGTVSGVDPEPGSTLTYALTNNAGGRFAINATTGVVTVANGSLLDYETAASQAITVRVTDQGGLTYDKNFTIGVTNVNEAPTNITLSNSSVMEHSPSETVVGTLLGGDPDSGSTFTYSLTNDAGGLFKIAPGSNVLVTAGGWTSLDYNTASSQSVTVKVTDQGGLSYTKTFTVAITPDHTTVMNGDGSTTTMIYDAPNLYSWYSFRTDANAQGTVTYQIGTTDGGGTWQNEYDVRNTQSWSTRMTVTNAAHQVVSQTTVNDNNTLTLVANDVGNAYGWSTFTMQYTWDADTGWNYSSTSGVNDNGTTTLDMSQVWNSFDTLLWYSSPYVVTQGSLGGGDDPELPVILDLDGNGVDVTPLGSSSAFYNMDGGPGRVHTAWVGGSDGFLAIDLAANGGFGPDAVIDQAREIEFSAWAPGSTSDMAALRQVFDTNHDGELSAADEHWDDFRIWQDANGDGISQSGEVHRLSDFGISSMDLNPTGAPGVLADGSVIQGLSSYMRTDGTTGLAGDVALAIDRGHRLPDPYSLAVQAMAVHSDDRGFLPSPELLASQAQYNQAAQGTLTASWRPAAST